MLQFFRDAIFARGMSLILATSFTAVSCAKNEMLGSLQAPQAELQSYTGEQLFRGIFLLEGEVGAKLPSLQGVRLMLENENRRNPDLAKLRSQRNQQIVDAVFVLDADYPTELKAAVNSQQFDQIEAVLRKGTSLLETACLGNVNDKAWVEKARMAVKEINLSKFDFTKEEDVDKFATLMKEKQKSFAASLPNKSKQDSHNTSFAAADALAFQTDIAFAFEISIAVLILLVAVLATQVYGGVANEFEHEILVKDIALNLNSQLAK